MKILMIHQDMREPGQGGGAESLLRDQTRALSALGHEIVWMHDGIIERVVQAHQPDVLHFMTLHERWADLAPLVWAQQQGIPHIIHVQDYWPFCFSRMLLVNGDQSCAAVHGICDNACGGRRDNYLPILNRSFVVAGNAYTAEIYRRNGLRCDAVVELGIDTELFHPEPASRTETPSVWTSAAWPSFPTKGMHVLERAVRGTGLSVKLLSGISRERVAEGLRRAHIYVFPSCYEETFGLCLCEAMASGCAVVASAVAGARAQVHDGMGMLVPPRDPMALRDAIVSLLSDPMRCREMGEAARMHAVVEHSLLAMGKRWEAAYRRVISGVK